MRKTLIAVAAGLMALSAASAQAASFDQSRQGQPEHAAPMRPNETRTHQTGPVPYMQNTGPSQPDMRRGDNHGPDNTDRYGAWQTSWGARPSDPPAHFSRHGDWYRHVHACQSRFRSYNPHTDRYTARHGQTAVCRL